MQEQLKILIERIKNERDLLLVPKEISKYARVTERTIRTWLNNGTLHGFKLGKKLWRISIQQLQIDFPNLPEQFWIDVAIDHYGHPKTMEALQLSLSSLHVSKHH